MRYLLINKKNIKKFYPRFKEGGFTLVEVLISLGMFSVIIGTLFGMLISLNTFFSQISAMRDVSFMSRKVMNMIVKEIRPSQSEIVEIWDRPIDQTGVIQDHINGRSVTFQLPVDYDDDGDVYDDELLVIEWGAEGEWEWVLEYCWDDENNRVLRRVWNNNLPSNLISEVVIAENISSFRVQGFSYNSATGSYESNPAEYVRDIIEITVTAERTTLAGRTLDNPFTFTISQRVFCRN